MNGRTRNRASKLAHWASLALTAAPGAPGLKLLAEPSFRGGPSNKASQLSGMLAGRSSPYGTVLALSAVGAPLPLLRFLRRRGVRVIVNQNGVYYPSWAGAGFRAKNDYLARLNALADHTFFQSEFARATYEEWVGPAPASASILHNGVDLARFSPGPRAGDPLTLLFFLDYRDEFRPYWSHLFGWLESPSFPLKEYRVLAVGNCAPGGEALLAEMKRNEKAEFHANLGPSELRPLLSRSDIFPHLVYNDVCPNKVLEAMASGVWTMGVSAGGTRELIGDSGAVLSVPTGYGAPVLPEFAAMSAALVKYLADPAAAREGARKQAEKFSLEAWKAEILRVSRGMGARSAYE